MGYLLNSLAHTNRWFNLVHLAPQHGQVGHPIWNQHGNPLRMRPTPCLSHFRRCAAHSLTTEQIAGVSALIIGSKGGRAAWGPDAARLTHERLIASGQPVSMNNENTTWT